MSRILNVKLVLDARAFESAMSRVQNKIIAFGSKLEQVGQSLSTRISLPLGLVGGAAIKAAGDMQALQLAMQAITGDAAAAAKEIDRLRKIALLPGIDLEQAIQGSIRLQTVGFSADEAAFSLAQFAKAVTLSGGSAQDLDEVVRQMTQIIGKGKLLSEDLKVILSRVPSLGLALRDAFGTTSIEAIRNSGISVQEFTKKLILAISQNERFNAVQGGINNALVNFQSAVKQSLAVLGEEIIRVTKLDEVLTALAGSLQGAIEWFRALDPATKQAIVVTGLLATAIGPLLIGVGALTKALPLLTKGISAFGVTGAAVTSVLAGITFAFFKLVEELGSVEEAIAFVQAKFAGIGAVVSEVGAIAKQSFRDLILGLDQALRGNFKLAGQFLAGEAGSVGERVGDAYRTAFENSLRASAFAAGRKEVERALDIPVPDFANLLSQQGGAAIDSPDVARKVPKTEAETAPRVLIPAFSELATKATDANIAMLEVVSTQSAVTEAFEQVRQSLTLQNETLATQQSRFQAIANTLTGPIQEGFSGFFETLLSGGKNAFKAFGEAIKALIKRLLTAVATALALSAVFSLITGGAGSALTLLGGSGSGFGGLFKTLLRGGLGFAKGGLVTGPTAALIGEGPGTTRANPEVVAPLDKLQQILGNTQPTGFIASTRLDGNDLLILIERAERNRAR